MNLSTGMTVKPPLQSPVNANGNAMAFPFTSFSFNSSSNISLRKLGLMCLPSKPLQWTSMTKFNKDITKVLVHEKHINKEVIALTPQLYDYILANVREPQVSLYRIENFSFTVVS